MKTWQEILHKVFDTVTNAIGVKLLASSTGTTVSDSFTRPNNTTAYATLDVVGEDPAANLEFTNVLSIAGGTFAVLSAKIRIDVNAVPAGMTGFRLHLYDTAPATTIADNAAYNLPAGDRGKYLGYISLTTVITDNGDTVWVQEDNVGFNGKLAASSTTLYGILQTIGAFTPSAQDVFTVTLNVAAI